MGKFWETFDVPKGGVVRWQIAKLDLIVQRLPGEWRLWYTIGKLHDAEVGYEFSREPETSATLSTKRYTHGSADDSLTIEPRFTDRPIVSYPEAQVEVPSGEKATFYCGIPLWVCLKAGSGRDAIELITLPLRHLSKTWFGTPLEGEPCYSSATAASMDVGEITSSMHRAICPITVKNQTKSSLPIDRICVHVEHLQLFHEDSRLWTNEVYVSKSSQHETSQVTYGKGAPKSNPGATLKLPPRVPPPQDNLILKTFNHIRTVLGD